MQIDLCTLICVYNQVHMRIEFSPALSSTLLACGANDLGKLHLWPLLKIYVITPNLKGIHICMCSCLHRHKTDTDIDLLATIFRWTASTITDSFFALELLEDDVAFTNFYLLLDGNSGLVLLFLALNKLIVMEAKW